MTKSDRIGTLRGALRDLFSALAPNIEPIPGQEVQAVRVLKQRLEEKEVLIQQLRAEIQKLLVKRAPDTEHRLQQLEATNREYR